ncbi:MAG: hypothetical protein COX90_02165 [Candidatus Nealsonbacteria bacterium CG_4_10_14_0_2_um_filter_38_17]|uniref:Metallo-beta-lactamase domain-containing protein n=2 Tax=Candidatus Nealsoniibacteriota TaxID=1817911 RepID=A0A2M7UY86_9BACT|nr:MAG: hypothetical protein COX36_04160 [Candidatus Nealsonbacteria bacterium CG23_combo_of_CG06-09_8_20_14_all_38_19]PIZ88888.1 MAG: hypothetical protein COX90_02165 [Candidatus Nealsonbacteria bacterium CG_4_10_14_0_2_um_filter_38_17]
MARMLYFRPSRRGFEADSRVDEFGRADYAEGFHVRLCQGCHQCSGPPSLFIVGFLNVELELRSSFFGLRRFFLAHPVRSGVESQVPAPVVVREPLPTLLAFDSVNAFIYSNPQDPSQTFLVDCGVGFSEEGNGNGLQLAATIPRLLQINWDLIKAVVLTHPHQDHWNLLKYKPSGIPVYCTPLAREFLEFQAKFDPGIGYVLRNVHVFDPNSAPTISLGSLELRTFLVPHSVPESVALSFRLGNKRIVHLGEFKFQGLDPRERVRLENHLRALGEEGVDLAVIDVQNIETPGFTPSESEILESLRDVLARITSPRIFLTCFSSNLERIQGLSLLAFQLNMNFELVGTGMRKAQDLAHLFRSTRIDFSRRTLYLITGCQVEKGSALWKEIHNAYGFYGYSLNIGQRDTLIFSSRAIPGHNESRVRDCIQTFQRRGVRVIVNTGQVERLGLTDVQEALVHTSGHASLGDVKLALQLLKPRYVVPRPPVQSVVEQLRLVAEEKSKGRIEVLSESRPLIKVVRLFSLRAHHLTTIIRWFFYLLLKETKSLSESEGFLFKNFSANFSASFLFFIHFILLSLFPPEADPPWAENHVIWRLAKCSIFFCSLSIIS